ncbi:MAG: hypothetical protein MK108_04225 [Mariniblastus sp.]|nr:hypothetical protein [Mariniblastus sp.]
MEARYCFLVCLCASTWIFADTAWAQGQYRAATTNFVITAPDPNLAREAGRLAEQYRRELSKQWLGYEIENWKEKCPVQIKLGPHAGGETSFAFMEGQKSEPIGWQMKIFGPPDRVLDAVLPHEITHTIFATHFGQPLPRWADEGACTTVEHESERNKNHEMLMNFLTAKPSRGIPFNRMFTMKRYPHDILPLYAQGYSLAKFLIAQKGHVHFVKFIEQGLGEENRNPRPSATKIWDQATQQFYGYQDLSDLQIAWIEWVRKGSPTDATLDRFASAARTAENRAAAKVDNGQGDQVTVNPLQHGNVVEHVGGWYAQQTETADTPDLQTHTATHSFVPPAEAFLPGSTAPRQQPAGPTEEPGPSSVWR